tara:strand:+ start:18937 stop:19143 length:207 start_codon:yes stop_codon:yes gene_type:complete
MADEYKLGIGLAIVIVTERLRQCRVELAYEEGKSHDQSTLPNLVQGRIRELEDLLKRFNNLLRTQDDK